MSPAQCQPTSQGTQTIITSGRTWFPSRQNPWICKTKYQMLQWSVLSVSTAQLVISSTACRQWSGARHSASATRPDVDGCHLFPSQFGLHNSNAVSSRRGFFVSTVYFRRDGHSITPTSSRRTKGLGVSPTPAPVVVMFVSAFSRLFPLLCENLLTTSDVI